MGLPARRDTRLVNVHVQRLRSKVEKDPERPEIVVTVRGAGYRPGRADVTERRCRSGAGRGAGLPRQRAGHISLFRRLWRVGRLLPDVPPPAPVHPVLRLYARWVRRPAAAAMRLWRRNMQLRVVATTLLMSLRQWCCCWGSSYIGQVRTTGHCLLEASKRNAAQSQSTRGAAQGTTARGTQRDERVTTAHERMYSDRRRTPPRRARPHELIRTPVPADGSSVQQQPTLHTCGQCPG
ncbi:hypothetical protein GCM10020221_22210 [Streptomyces thioluteus]|uniref:OmpR/PhoB-type domain-containing protein n=1 Tax=Streptomyces thioluteus TaxID=66431 RepID=A0ABN3WRX5_STRTU